MSTSSPSLGQLPRDPAARVLASGPYSLEMEIAYWVLATTVRRQGNPTVSSLLASLRTRIANARYMQKLMQLHTPPSMGWQSLEPVFTSTAAPAKASAESAPKSSKQQE